MRTSKSPHDASLLDILVDGFEKNDVLDGFHDRILPLPDEVSAIAKFADLLDELARWKGEPLRIEDDGTRRAVIWTDIELIQVERGIMVRVRAPRFASWWVSPDTWRGDPLGALYDWLAERRVARPE